MTEFKVPELGENVSAGDVLRVLVSVGDTIEKEQPVIELETDKATVEVPSSVAGVVKEIRVKAGDKVQVGSVLLTVDDNGAGSESAADAVPPADEQPEQKAAPKPVERAQPRAEAKPEPEPEPEPETKVEAKAEQKQDQKVVSMPRGSRPEAVPARSPDPKPAPQPASQAARSPKAPAAPASPSVRRLAREIGVDINEVRGSGPQGRISDEDVKEHARRLLTGGAAPASGPPAAASAMPLPDFARWGEIDRQPMSSIRRATALRLGHAWNVVPHVTQFDKADITGMEELRRTYREQVQQAGGNLTVTAMLVKVLATAVTQFPQFNSSLDPEAGEIVFKKYINIGVAVDTDRGLLVPVIRNADQKNITEIAVEVHQLAQKARDRKLTLEEMSGGGMTISNLGGIGGTYFTPIVNWPEVAILGVSRGVIEPVWRPSAGPAPGPSAGSGQGSFEPRQLLPLSLSYDHRVIDGADAMRFLRWIVEGIEQPFLLSLLG
jgi:pyruvate dehydrogenase E2 component (dihydrolipoamide acetyltransferase)